MDIERQKRTFRVTQIAGAVIFAGGSTAWKVIASFQPSSEYYAFVNSADFNMLNWIAASALMPCLVGIGFYFVLGSVFKKRLAANATRELDKAAKLR